MPGRRPAALLALLLLAAAVPSLDARTPPTAGTSNKKGAAVVARSTSSANTKSAADILSSDPEKIFDVLSTPANILRITGTDGSALAGPTVNAITDGAASTLFSLNLPSGSLATPQKLLTVTLTKQQPVVEVSLRLAPASSSGDYTPCLSRAYWEDDRGQRYTTNDNREVAGTPNATRIGWLVPVVLDKNGLVGLQQPKTLSLVLPVGCKASTAVAAVTELQAFTKPSLKAIGGSAPGIADDHFHPCSFSHFCSKPTEIAAEQKRQGVVVSMWFGLQHNMIKAANQWLEAVFGKDTPRPDGEIDITPFHYNDLGALPSSYSRAKPGLAQVNKKRAEKGLPPIDSYEGWPMWSNTKADYVTVEGYSNGISQGQKGLLGAAFPFMSSLRIDQPSKSTLYTICTKDASGMTYNEKLIRAFDSLFPKSVFGFQEYNLNKTIVAEHDVPAPVIDETWLQCIAPVFKYIAETNRPFGIHFDITPWKNDQTIFAVGKRFPEVTMIWDHGGFAPEVDKRLAAKDHLALLQAWLDTAPKGKRLIDVSWNTGFFLRFNPLLLGDVEIDSATGAERPRDWVADCRAYMSFFKQHSDKIMFGSDQVSLDYEESVSKDLEGAAIYNRPGYSQATTYGAAMRQQLGYFNNCMTVAGPGYQLSPRELDAIFINNARSLMGAVKHPSVPEKTGMNKDQARAFIKELVTLQWKEAKKAAGEDAEPLSEFLPASLRN